MLCQIPRYQRCQNYIPVPFCDRFNRVDNFTKLSFCSATTTTVVPWIGRYRHSGTYRWSTAHNICATIAKVLHRFFFLGRMWNKISGRLISHSLKCPYLSMLALLMLALHISDIKPALCGVFFHHLYIAKHCTSSRKCGKSMIVQYLRGRGKTA